MTRSLLGQLAFFTAVAESLDPSSLNLRESPAQKGQSMMSPGLAVSGISNSRWHSGQTTVFISQSQEPFQPSPIKTHYNFLIHYNDRRSPAANLLDQLLHGRRILDNIAIRK